MEIFFVIAAVVVLFFLFGRKPKQPSSESPAPELVANLVECRPLFEGALEIMRTELETDGRFDLYVLEKEKARMFEHCRYVLDRGGNAYDVVCRFLGAYVAKSNDLPPQMKDRMAGEIFALAPKCKVFDKLSTMSTEGRVSGYDTFSEWHDELGQCVNFLMANGKPKETDNFFLGAEQWLDATQMRRQYWRGEQPEPVAKSIVGEFKLMTR